MKLLLDQNLSPRLVNRLADCYPDSQHVYEIGLDQADDTMIWDYAQQNNFVIITRDADFNEISLVRGFPPKIVWIRRGNCSTNEIENILRSHLEDIKKFSENPNVGVLTLF